MIAVRSLSETDDGYVVDRLRSSFAEHVCPGADRAHLRDELQRLRSSWIPRGIGSDIFGRPTFRVACDEKDPDTILGFICFSGDELHYVFVERKIRRTGVASKLLDGLPIQRYTFKTTPFMTRIRPDKRGWKYTPRWTID